jgi:hypothetical protein
LPGGLYVYSQPWDQKIKINFLVLGFNVAFVVPVLSELGIYLVEPFRS